MHPPDNNAEQTLEAMAEAVVRTDCLGRITFLNSAAEKLTGYKRAQAIGKQFDELIIFRHSRIDQPLASPLAETLANRVATDIPPLSLLDNRSGVCRPVAGTATPVPGPDGKPVGVVLILRDLREEIQRGKMTRILSKTADASLRAVTLLDEHGVLLHANAAFLKMWGYDSAQEIENKPFASYLHGPDPLAGIIKPGSFPNWKGELLACKKSGGIFYVDGAFSPVYDDYDGQMFVLASFMDATERRLRADQLQTYNRELLALASASHKMLSIADKSQLCQSICDQALGITGADYAWLGLVSAVPQRLHTCHFTGKDKKYIDELPTSRKADTPELVALETMAPFLCNKTDDPSMSTRWKGLMQNLGVGAALSLPIASNTGESLGVLTLLSGQPEHFTEQRLELYEVFCNQVAVSLENLQILTELEMKVEERTLELKTQKILAEEARVLAESSNKAKSEFLANMSHELRTPLNVVIGCSDIITANMYGELNQKQREYMDFIKNSAQHLLSLINDILDLSKIEYGKMELSLSQVKVRPMLETIVKLLGERAARAQVSLRLELPQDGELCCSADQRKLKQIIFNLASNAIKFSPQQSEVILSAAFVRDRALLPKTAELPPDAQSYLLITVRDRGIGIKPQDLGKLFQAFTQLDSDNSREYEGSGLGLALTKKLVELHGGAIWAESEYGKGSVFSCALPQNTDIEENNATKH